MLYVIYGKAQAVLGTDVGPRKLLYVGFRRRNAIVTYGPPGDLTHPTENFARKNCLTKEGVSNHGEWMVLTLRRPVRSRALLSMRPIKY